MCTHTHTHTHTQIEKRETIYIKKKRNNENIKSVGDSVEKKRQEKEREDRDLHGNNRQLPTIAKTIEPIYSKEIVILTNEVSARSPKQSSTTESRRSQKKVTQAMNGPGLTVLIDTYCYECERRKGIEILKQPDHEIQQQQQR